MILNLKTCVYCVLSFYINKNYKEILKHILYKNLYDEKKQG